MLGDRTSQTKAADRTYNLALKRLGILCLPGVRQCLSLLACPFRLILREGPQCVERVGGR